VSNPIIISGRLSKISDATKVPGNSWLYEYIKVDERRLNNVFVANYINDDFRDGLGEEITLSLAPTHKKNFTGMVVALRKGTKVERSPELSTGRAVCVTLINIGLNILPYAIVSFLIFVGLYIGIEGLIYVFKNGSSGGDNEDVAITAILLTLVIMIQQLFISKKSPLGSRDSYNAAVRALD
jgi:hypothetical protein